MTRPESAPAMALASLFPTPPWLSLIGIGEDGRDGLSPAATRLVAQAALVVGGARHLALARPLRAQTLQWPSPISDAMPQILARRGEAVCVLASGDPFFYGVGALLMRHFSAAEMICLPAPSSFSLAAARLGWPLQDCALVSLHGRELANIARYVQPGARLLALSWDGSTPQKLANWLNARDFGGARLTICERLGGPHERLRTLTAQDLSAADFASDAINPLNIIGVEIEAGPKARFLPLASGLPDEWFAHDGQITRRAIRAMTLAALAPRRGELLWDIGAGSGSVSIEWMLADAANRAYAIEQSPERAQTIARNAQELGTPGLRIIQGRAPAALADLPRPDAIFVGGGASAPAMIDNLFAQLEPRGRLVINAVTLETQAALTGAYAKYGGRLLQIALAEAEPVGRFQGWRAQMPVVQWSFEKK